jgi:diacylglycerol kinase family enzyme
MPLESTDAGQTLASASELRRHVIAFVNETAGSGPKHRHIAALRHVLKSAGFEVHVRSQIDELTQLASEVRDQLRAVVAVGGDGTVGAVLNATAPGTPICVLPLGTENLLAKYLRMSAKPRKICELLERGLTIELDAGRANGRLFALLISAGFDAEVVRRVHEVRDGNITRWNYAKPIFEAIRNYNYPEIRLSAHDSGPEQVWSGRWVFGVNLPRYARNLPIAPRAVGTDSQLDWCLFERGSLGVGLWYLWHVVWRRHHRLASVTTFRHGACRLETVDPHAVVPYQLDGDPGGVLPVTVETVPNRLTALVMPEVARQLGSLTASTNQ